MQRKTVSTAVPNLSMKSCHLYEFILYSDVFLHGKRKEYPGRGVVAHANSSNIFKPQ